MLPDEELSGVLMVNWKGQQCQANFELPPSDDYQKFIRQRLQCQPMAPQQKAPAAPTSIVSSPTEKTGETL